MGGLIASSSGGTDPASGAAGSVQLTADTIRVDSDGTIAASTVNGQQKDPADDGQVGLTTDTLTLRSGGQVQVATTGTGNAGDITVAGRTRPVAALVDVSGTGTVLDPLTGQLRRSGLVSSSTLPGATAGRAGSIGITADRITVASNGQIAASTSGGQGGQVNLNTDRLEVASDAEVAASTSGTGDGGQVNVSDDGEADNQALVVVVTGGDINTTASGSGDAGQVNITAQTVTVVRSSQASELIPQASCRSTAVASRVRAPAISPTQSSSSAWTRTAPCTSSTRS